MDLLVLKGVEVRDLIDPGDLLDELAEGFKGLTAGRVSAPGRNQVTTPEGFLMSMPAFLAGNLLAVKLVSVFEGNHDLGIPSHHAVIVLFDSQTGVARAILDGTYLTALRTAGGAALSARLLAREDAKILTIIGAGVEGETHLTLVPTVRPFQEIQIASRTFEHAQKLASLDPRARAVESIEEAVRSADVLCLCTSSAVPILDMDWLRAGVHVTSVGYNPPGGELPREINRSARVFVETRQAFEPPPVGSSELVGIKPQDGSELGEVLLNLRPGRRSDGETTIYKSMGHAMEDMIAANMVYRRALAAGMGKVVEI
jgi:alanine dehydrogenase